jgi:hypothetical protein
VQVIKLVSENGKRKFEDQPMDGEGAQPKLQRKAKGTNIFSHGDEVEAVSQPCPVQLSWNGGGLGNPRTVRDLHNLLKE